MLRLVPSSVIDRFIEKAFTDTALVYNGQ